MAQRVETQSGPFLVLFGDENHLLDQAIEEIKSGNAREVITFDGNGLDANELVSFCESIVPDKNIGIIVDDAQNIKNGNILSKFIERRNPSDKSVFLLFVARSEALKEPWIKAAVSRGKSTQYKKPKPWETHKQITRIQEAARKIGVTLEDGVPALLIKFLGYDLALIYNELRKAHYLVGGDRKVSKKIILSLIPHVFPIQPFEVVEAAASKKVQQAMTSLGLVYRNLGEGASIPITYALMKMVERLLIARDLSDKGAGEEEIADRLGMHAYAYKMNLLPLVRLHPLPKLIEQMQNLCTLDNTIKGTANSKRTHVELAVLSFAA
jgi:DNA polymerase III delta subunit